MSMPDINNLSWNEFKYRYIPETRDQRIILLSIFFSLLIVIILPVGSIIVFSFADSFPIMDGEFGFTLRHYTYLFENLSLLYEITLNSFIYAAGATFLAITVGTFAAFFTVKYLNDSMWVQLLMLIPYGIPSVAALVGWVILLGDVGVLTEAVMAVFNLSSSPWDLRSIWGMIFVEGVHTAPIAFLLMFPAIRNIPAAMDEASFTAGANRIRTFRQIILPVVWPSVLSTLLFLFVRTMATVTTPAVLGVPERIFTFGTAIPYIFLSGADLSYSKALSFSVFMIAITTVFILYYLKAQSAEDQFTTVLGAGRSEPRRYDSTILKQGLGITFVGAYLVIAGLLPFGAILWDSLVPGIMMSTDLSQFSLQNYIALFAGNAQGTFAWRRALWNTILVGVIVPTTGMIISMLIAYANQIIDIAFSKTFVFIASVPLAIPGIARSMGFLSVFIQTPIYGTWFILFIAYHGIALPIGMRYSSPALTRVGSENVEVSLASGAGLIRSFRSILLPLISKDFVAGWMHTYVTVIRNVSIPILLYTAGSEVIAIELLTVLRAGYANTASTMAVIITLLSILPHIVLQYWRVSGGLRGR